jgi:hypothetical protein
MTGNTIDASNIFRPCEDRPAVLSWKEARINEGQSPLLLFKQQRDISGFLARYLHLPGSSETKSFYGANLPLPNRF